MVSSIASADFATIWNSFTNRLDYIRGNTFDGNQNITGNLTVHGGVLIQASPPTTKMANLTLLDVINGTYAFSNLTLLSIDNGTSYALNATPVIGSPFFVYGANSSVALTLLTNSTDYSIDLTLGNLTVLNDDLSGYNLTVDYSARTIYDFNATNIINVKIYAAIKNGSLTELTLLTDGNYTVTSGGTFELKEFAWNGSNITLDYTRIDYTPVPAGSLFVEDNITANWIDAGTNWTNLDLYPVACPAGYFVTQIADEITCTASNQTFGDFNVSGNITTYMIRGQDLKPLAIGNWSTTHGLDSHNDLGVKGKFEIDGRSFFDGQVDMASTLSMGTSVIVGGSITEGSLQMKNINQIPNTMMLLTGTTSESLIIAQYLDRLINYAHLLQSTPTIFIHSSDETQIDEWLSFSYHNESGQAVFEVGDGAMNFSTKGHTNLYLGNDTWNKIGNGTFTKLLGPNDLGITGELEINSFLNANGGIITTTVEVAENNYVTSTNPGSDALVYVPRQNSQTPNTGMIGLGSSANSIIILENADRTINFAHPLQTNPTLFIQSSDETQIDEWLSFSYHNQSGQAVMEVGDGSWNFSTKGHTNLLLANDSYNRIGNSTTSQSLVSPNDLLVTGRLEVNGLLNVDAGSVFAGQLSIASAAKMSNGVIFNIGNDATDADIVYQTVQIPGALIIAPSDESKIILIMDQADHATVNFAHPEQTNPTIFIQSSDETQVDQWLSLAYSNESAAAIIATGVGAINLTTAGHTNLWLANDSYNRLGNGTTSNSMDSPNDLMIKGQLEIDGTTFFDGLLDVKNGILMRSNTILRDDLQNSGFMFRSTLQEPDTMMMLLGGISRHIVVTEYEDRGINFAHPLQSNPTIFIQSSDETQINQWLSLAYSNESAAAIIATGVGAINLTTAGHTNLWLANDSYNRFGNRTSNRGLDNPNDLFISGDVEFDATVFFDGQANFNSNTLNADNVRTRWGAIGDTGMLYSTGQTAHALILGLSLDSNNFIITQIGDVLSNFGHVLQSNPTLFIQSSDETQINQWLSFAYNNKTSQSIIANGAGDMNISAVGNITFGSGGGDLLLPDYMNVSWGGGARMWTNSSCLSLASPDGSTVTEICNA